MSDATILGALFVSLIGLQTFWISRALDKIERRLDAIENTAVKDHERRIVQLEERAR